MIGPEFDFEKMAHLSRTDPTAAKSYRDQLIADVIAAAPPEYQAGLRDFQRTIDLEISCYDDPLETARALFHRAVNQMWLTQRKFLEIGKLAREAREKLSFSKGIAGQ